MKGLNTQMRNNICDENNLLSTEIMEQFTTNASNVLESIRDNNLLASFDNDTINNIQINVFFVDEDDIREENNTNRGIDKATDVLSFPSLEMHNSRLVNALMNYDYEIIGDERILNLGDVLICPSVCKVNSEAYGHSLLREIVFVYAHSVLHLLGFDHMNDDDEKLMINFQKKIMVDIGLAFDEEIEFVNHNIEDIKLTNNSSMDNNIVYEAGSPCEHVGFVAIIGRPNVGKSTLLNYLTGMKVAIVSHKPQTTRTNIRSIYNGENSQLVFVDTPGVHKPKSELSRIMVENSFKGAKNADVVLMLTDGRFTTPGQVEKDLIDLAVQNNKKLILAINKSDDISKESLLPTIAAYSSLAQFEEIIPISAKTGDNVEVLISKIEELLPAGPRLFDTEMMTNQTEREIVSELIREQVLHYVNQEIPHGTAVVIDSFDEKYKPNPKDEYDREMVVIHASIIVERKSHKGIILGKDGQMIKRIGTKSRISIERLCGCKVYLELFVKVREDWKNDSSYLKSYGYTVEEDD